jgi:hypothetical protein
MDDQEEINEITDELIKSMKLIFKKKSKNFNLNDKRKLAIFHSSILSALNRMSAEHLAHTLHDNDDSEECITRELGIAWGFMQDLIFNLTKFKESLREKTSPVFRNMNLEII